ncbi:hypothetical protein SSP35_08_00680 [Streptomyces sp. NBRC 110611]|uniref:hypothetical protein n=1 Tax=Streptomyces sp. NBRC 110611 TaxID=1621259 RepID=UPI00085732B8|nr:hypothetical protein [Streptomyces sp. NBRC 110611]GAU68574.1 hypothetical protein SSP35_08_00680 [Streptomyces sp. NBRC 110611]
MTTPVDAEQAWQDLQRIRVPQERVYDEVERCARGDAKSTYISAAIMWVFLASMGLDLPNWAVLLVLAAYLALLGAVAVYYSRRSRMRLHRSRHSWRQFATFLAGAVLSGTVIVGSGRLVESLALPFGSLIQATLSAGFFVLFVGPANRWAIGTLRTRDVKPAHVEACR